MSSRAPDIGTVLVTGGSRGIGLAVEEKKRLPSAESNHSVSSFT